MTSNLFQQIGSNIQDALQERGMPQQYLAESLNIPEQVVEKITKGEKAINILEASKIADVLDIPVERLLNIKDVNIESTNAKDMPKSVKTIIDEFVLLENMQKDV